MKEIVERLKEQREIEKAKEIMESNGYKVSKKINESRSTEIEDMMDYIDDAQQEMYALGDGSKFDEILKRYHASEDDEGEEGYFSTMSDDDIRGAYKELTDILEDPEYDAVVSDLLKLGFEKHYVESVESESSMAYYTKGSVAILVGSPEEIVDAARELL